MTDKTQSGYEITIKAFIPADPHKPQTMRDAGEVLRMLKEHAVIVGLKDFGDGCIGLPGVTVSEPRWIARRKVPAPSSSPETDSGGTGGANPNPAPPAAGPTREECERNQAGADTLPAFLDRRVPRI